MAAVDARAPKRAASAKGVSSRAPAAATGQTSRGVEQPLEQKQCAEGQMLAVEVHLHVPLSAAADAGHCIRDRCSLDMSQPSWSEQLGRIIAASFDHNLAKLGLSAAPKAEQYGAWQYRWRHEARSATIVDTMYGGMGS